MSQYTTNGYEENPFIDPYVYHPEQQEPIPGESYQRPVGETIWFNNEPDDNHKEQDIKSQTIEDRFNVNGERGQEVSDNMNIGSNDNPLIGMDTNGNRIFLEDILYDKTKREKYGFDDKKLTQMVLYGTLTPSKLKERLSVLKDNTQAINYILQNQANLSLDKNASSYSVNRTEQFLTTVAYLKEIGFNFSQLSFLDKNGNNIEFYKFMANYGKQAIREATPLEGKINTTVFGDDRINGNITAMATSFVKEEFAKSPQKFEMEYQNYLMQKGKTADTAMLTYADFIRERYGFDIPREMDINAKQTVDKIASQKGIAPEELLQQFEIERQKQFEKDKLEREQLVKNTITKNAQFNIFDQAMNHDENKGRSM